MNLQLGAVQVPDWLTKPSGVFLYDIFPLVSLAACVPTLYLFWHYKKRYDLVLFTTGLGFATVFHVLHMNEKGLDQQEWLGVPATTWRTLDILAANAVLGRILCITLACYHPVVLGLATWVLPLTLCSSLVINKSVHIQTIAKLTSGILLATTGLKLVVEGYNSLPQYPSKMLGRVIVFFSLGFFSFYMPHEQPSMYWFWHSLWHVFMGVAVYEVCRYILPQKQKLKQR